MLLILPIVPPFSIVVSATESKAVNTPKGSPDTDTVALSPAICTSDNNPNILGFNPSYYYTKKTPLIQGGK